MLPNHHHPGPGCSCDDCVSAYPDCPMTAAQFRSIANAHGMTGRTREALELVMVSGLSAYAAARRVGVDKSAISRARQRIERPLCPHCHGTGWA